MVMEPPHFENHINEKSFATKIYGCESSTSAYHVRSL